MSAERKAVVSRARGLKLASTGPRSIERGEDGVMDSGDIREEGFNGAALN